jgi:hypothetical protein
MSRRRGLIVAGAAAVVLARGVGAQETGRLDSVLDTLTARHAIATARRQAFDDSVSRTRASFDTVRSGPLTVLVTRADRSVATAAARMALDSLVPLGDSLLRRLDGLRFVMRSSGPSSWELTRPRAIWESRPERRVTLTLLDHNNIERNQIQASAFRPAALAPYMIDHARVRLAQSVPASLARWAGGMGGTGGTAPIRFDTTLAFEWALLRLDLVSSASFISRGCFDGRAADCRHVLGLDSSATPVQSYFDAAGRRDMVRRHGEVLRRRDYTRTEECLAGTDAACAQLLERGPADLSIGSVGHRVSLLQLAIQVGGPDATMRVFRGDGSVAEQLAAIAGMPVDSLTALWLTRVRNQRVASDNMAAGMAAASLGWIGLLGLLALRNKRWR